MKKLIYILMCSLLITGPAPAIEFKEPNMLILSDEEQAACDSGGGCYLVPELMFKKHIEQIAERAYKAGKASCGRST